MIVVYPYGNGSVLPLAYILSLPTIPPCHYLALDLPFPINVLYILPFIPLNKHMHVFLKG